MVFEGNMIQRARTDSWSLMILFHKKQTMLERRISRDDE